MLSMNKDTRCVRVWVTKMSSYILVCKPFYTSDSVEPSQIEYSYHSTTWTFLRVPEINC